MKSLGIIIARKNSKRLKNKNILRLGKLKLYEYPLIAAIKSEKFNKIIVSTDDKKIISNYKKYIKFKNVFFEKRPSKFCTDKSKAIDTVNYYVSKNKKKYSKIALMLPTCPFRDYKDINMAFKKLDKKTTSVISVTKYSFPIQFAISLNKDIAKYFFKNSDLVSGKTRSQDKKDFFHPNGGIYLSWINKIKKNKNFFKGRVRCVVMDKKKSIDIDHKEDYQLAKLRLNKFYNNFKI